MPECTWEVIRGYMANPVEEDILPPEEDKTEELAMEKLRLQATIAEAELAKAEIQAASANKTAGAGKRGVQRVRPGSGGNGNTKATSKVLFWRKLRDRIAELGGDVTNPKAALADLADLRTPWATEALKLINAERWDDAFKLDMSADPELKPPDEPLPAIDVSA